MTSQQVQKIVKAFGFKKKEKDSYYLKLNNYTVFLYYFKSNNKCWEIQIFNREYRVDFIREIKKPTDIFEFIIECSSRIVIDKHQKIVKSKLFAVCASL